MCAVDFEFYAIQHVCIRARPDIPHALWQQQKCLRERKLFEPISAYPYFRQAVARRLVVHGIVNLPLVSRVYQGEHSPFVLFFINYKQ